MKKADKYTILATLTLIAYNILICMLWPKILVVSAVLSILIFGKIIDYRMIKKEFDEK